MVLARFLLNLLKVSIKLWTTSCAIYEWLFHCFTIRDRRYKDFLVVFQSLQYRGLHFPIKFQTALNELTERNSVPPSSRAANWLSFLPLNYVNSFKTTGPRSINQSKSIPSVRDSSQINRSTGLVLLFGAIQTYLLMTQSLFLYIEDFVSVSRKVTYIQTFVSCSLYQVTNWITSLDASWAKNGLYRTH